MKFLAITTAIILTTAQVGLASFAASCNNINLVNGYILRANCLDYGGARHTTSLNLNYCVGVKAMDAGFSLLTYIELRENGNFQSSGGSTCNGCYLQNSRTQLTCQCLYRQTNQPDERVPMAVNLSAGVRNDNGYLACYNRQGTRP